MIKSQFRLMKKKLKLVNNEDKLWNVNIWNKIYYSAHNKNSIFAIIKCLSVVDFLSLNQLVKKARSTSLL